MSDTPQSGNNGAAGAAPNAAQPSLTVMAQYLKDLSFESPRAPVSFKNAQQPQIDVNVDVQGRSIGTDQYEVELSVSAKASHENEPVFIVEASYAGAFEIKNMPREQLEGIMLVECPRLLFPFMRQIISDATRNGNFPPLMLEPIDFMGIYLANQKQRQAAAASPAEQNA
ncbi:MAG: protein-export chaperone SecB [Pseudomonadota bacterium]